MLLLPMIIFLLKMKCGGLELLLLIRRADEAWRRLERRGEAVAHRRRLRVAIRREGRREGVDEPTEAHDGRRVRRKRPPIRPAPSLLLPSAQFGKRKRPSPPG